MKRRTFLQATLGLSSLLVSAKYQKGFSALAPVAESADGSSYQPGERISEEAFVLDRELNRNRLIDLLQERAEAAVVVLYIFGGGAMKKQKLGGIWCPDSFEDLQIPRYLHLKYNEEAVQLLPVAIPPVYATANYGLKARVFLDEPRDSELFRESAEEFIASTEQVFYDGFIPVEPFFDVRNRLLFNPREDLKPGKGYGPVYPWQGRFRAPGEEQKYGVPTIWLLTPEGEVLEPPFHGNHYHDSFEIGYTLVDVDRAIQKYL